MWDEPFDVSDIGRIDVVVNCPERSLLDELSQLVANAGAHFPGGQTLLDEARYWNEHNEDTCYFIDRGKCVLYGPKDDADFDDYSHYKKCTFSGSMSDFEPANDSEMRGFLGF